MRGGQTLAVLLVAVLILVIVATLVWFAQRTPLMGGERTKGQTTYGAALERAKELECLNNLQQIRTVIQAYIATNGSNPPNLSAVSLPGGVQPVCPITKAPYNYDAASGTIRCPQHPKF